MTGGELSIRLEPTVASVSMSRIFVTTALSVAGVDPVRVSDARLMVSDLATALVGEGEPVEIRASFDDDTVVVEGNLPGLMPEAGALLLGDALQTSDSQWTLTLPTR